MADKQYTMVDTLRALSPGRALLAAVVIQRIYDPDADLSYLEQDYSDCDPAEAERYRAQDYKRLMAYNRGDWYTIGLRAHATIMLPAGAHTAHIQTITSPGLWGIESDSEPAYFTEIAHDELATLRAELDMLSVNTSHWTELNTWETVATDCDTWTIR